MTCWNLPRNRPLRLRAGFLLRSTFLTALALSSDLAAAAPPEKISDSALRQIHALQQEKLSRSNVHRKLDSQFVFKLKQNRGEVIAPGVSKMQAGIKLEADGRVLVDIDASVTEDLLAQIKRSGGTVINSFPHFHSIRASVSLAQLESLAGSSDVKFIRRAREAHTNTGSVTSEGDVTHRANAARNKFGATGHGVKVGVLSDSIDYLSLSQATGDLGDVTILPGQDGSGSGEGTAMLEIIHDLAPGAQLFFATAFNGEASFAQNILNLRSNGCDIIVDDVGYFDESPFQDALIAQAVNTVTASGALYFSAAGNGGNLKDKTSGTWEGDFVDGGPAVPPVNIGGGTIHSFGPATFNTVIYPGYGVDLFWADPLGASTNDYDLFVLDSTGANVVASSLNLQNGTQDPYESIFFVGQGEQIVIVKASGEGRFLHVETGGGALSVNTGGATRGHSAAAAAFSVAAINAGTSYPNPFSGGSLNPVESFSSDGPRRMFFNADGTPITPGNFSSTGGTVRQKPDLTAADGVTSAVFGQFFGTSAAAPHAAAIGALLWSYNRALTPTQIRTVLSVTALDIEGPGIDINSGAGIVMADAALQSLPPQPVVIAGSSVLLSESCPSGSVDPGEIVTVAFSLINVGVADTTNLTATLLSSGGVTFPSGPQSYGSLRAQGGTTNRSFSFTAIGGCGGTNIATFQLLDGIRDLGTVSFTFRLGHQRQGWSENFDAVTAPALPPGWSVFSSGAAVSWRTTSAIRDTLPNSVFVPDPASIGETRLTSPILTMSTNQAAQVTFRHSYDVEEGFDGGVLEISINNGGFTDILAAGGAFASGGYNQTLSGFFGNPLSNSLAWSGSSLGFITTVVNLPASAAGKNVQLRWRFGSDDSFGIDGWYIDTISLSDGFDCCATVTNDLVVSISDSPDPVIVGGNLTYTISIINTGPAPANGVSLTEVLPASFTFQSISISQGVVSGAHANGGGALTFNLGDLPGRGTATVTIVGTADSVGLITNRVTVLRSDPDSNPSNNTATAVSSVILPSLTINDVTLIEGNAISTNAVFTVTVSPPIFQTVTVHFATSNLTAIAGSDYLATSGTLVFAPGVTNQTIVVPIIGERLNETDETFTVNLSTPSNAILEKSQGIATILNDDPLPNVSVTDATLIVPSSGVTNAVFDINLNVPSGQFVAIYYSVSDGTAIAGADYVPRSSTPLSFSAGQTKRTISVVVNSHVSVKPVQTFYVNLFSPLNAKVGRDRGLGTIITALPGQMDHFGWSNISSPQSNSLPFAVTLIAQDYFNSTISNFNGVVKLTGFSGPSIATSLIANGGFETGDFTGWVKETNGAGDFFINSGAFDPASPDGPLPPFAGQFSAVADQSGPAISAIYQQVTIPLNAASPHLQWMDRIRNHAGVFQDPNQEFRAEIRGLANNLLAIAYSTSPSDLPLNGWVQRSYDLSDFRGQTIRTAFVAQDDIYYFNLHLDDVMITAMTPAVISPTNSGNFTNGIWSGSVTVQQPTTNLTLRADDSFGHSGQSLPFDVVPTRGQPTHFAWSTIASPQSNGAPFEVTIIAQDYFNNTVSNFNGTVSLSGVASNSLVTNSILGDLTHSYTAADIASTLGYAFTPTNNILIKSVRHYFGTKVSIWTDAGVLLATRAVASIPGTWVETPLATPLLLNAGIRYRVGVYHPAAANYYARLDGTNAFSDGTIDQSYESAGDSFPGGLDEVHWWFVDLRYTTLSVPISPTNSGNFVSGAWSGSISVLQPLINVFLSAKDAQGHIGNSNPFDVIATIAELKIERFGNVVVLSWPAALSNFTLESTPIPGPQTNWVRITDSPSIMSNRNMVTNIITGSKMFYRLKKP